jgi:hypothetical protein
VVEHVAANLFGHVMADVSPSGTLVHATGAAGASDQRTMVWVDRRLLLASQRGTRVVVHERVPTNSNRGLWLLTLLPTPRLDDVSADGQRFLMRKEPDPQKDAPSLIVVQNWFEELKRRVPTN